MEPPPADEDDEDDDDDEEESWEEDIVDSDGITPTRTLIIDGFEPLRKTKVPKKRVKK